MHLLRPEAPAPAHLPGKIDTSYVDRCFLRMKTKLTLSIDAAAIKRAKAVARRRGIALSQLVEEHFDRLANHDAGQRFLDKWQGAFRIDPESLKDERVAAIVAKHVR